MPNAHPRSHRALLMNRKQLLNLCVAVLVPVVSGCSSTASNVTDEQAAATTAEPSSRQFVIQAAQGNLAEIQTSQLALSKSQNPDVRAFAQHMIDDHQSANQELAALALADNLTLPTSLDPEHERALQTLRSETGASFDAAYTRQMTQDHDKAIALFHAAVASERVDPRLKALAEKLLPTLEQHRDMVAKLESNPTTTRSASGPDERGEQR